MPYGSGPVSFPGLGIFDLNISRVAFRIFGMEIYWYGVIIATGFLLGMILATKLAERCGVNPDDLLTVALIAAPIAIAGARAYYVATMWENYDSLWEVVNLRDGGLAIYGGILAGLVSMYVLCRWKKIPIARALECAAPAVILGQAIGRWGNFFNQEAFGTATTLPWRMELVVGGVKMAVHPTFLYESLWNIAGCGLLLWVFSRRRFDGQVFWSYMGWYGFGRFFIEGLRTDSLYVGAYRISQVLAAVLFVASAAVLVLRLKKPAGVPEPEIEAELETQTGEPPDEEDAQIGDQD